MKLMPNDKPLQKDHREISLVKCKLIQKGKELPFKVVSVTRDYGKDYAICCIDLKDFEYNKEYFTLYYNFDAFYVPAAQVLSAKGCGLTKSVMLIKCKESS